MPMRNVQGRTHGASFAMLRHAVVRTRRDNVSCMVLLFEKGEKKAREFNAGLSSARHIPSLAIACQVVCTTSAHGAAAREVWVAV